MKNNHMSLRLFAAIESGRARRIYERIFSIQEIRDSVMVQWFFGAMLLFFFVTFERWINMQTISIQTAERKTAVCWPYFENCWRLYFLEALPNGYTQTFFYMVLYGIIVAIVFYMWKRDWVFAHFLLTALFLWKTFVVFVLSYTIAGPYDYYHIILSAILLFIPFKEYFLKLMFVFLYFMSVTVKFDSTWVLGTYFSAMQTGLPILPDAFMPFFTNIVIFMQVIGCWFLLSKRWLLQRLSLLFSLVFHFYSGILVLYTYPTITIPPLLILFGPLYRTTPIPTSRKAIAGWACVFLVAAFQLLGFVTPTERRLSLEGNRFGMFMFEANHQCIATVREYRTDVAAASSTTEQFLCSGFFCLTRTRIYPDDDMTVMEYRYESPSAWNRCDPYEWWARYHLQCERNPGMKRIALTFDHSINGGPFYRIVDEPDVCNLSYEPFVHNAWIKLPPEAPVVGYPLKNMYQY